MMLALPMRPSPCSQAIPGDGSRRQSKVSVDGDRTASSVTGITASCRDRGRVKAAR